MILNYLIVSNEALHPFARQDLLFDLILCSVKLYFNMVTQAAVKYPKN